MGEPTNACIDWSRCCRRRCFMITIASDSLLIAPDRSARVIAGPGAGKTYWLVEHTKNILRRSAKLHSNGRIAIISYTNVAADQLRIKLAETAARTEVSTIHSFLFRHVIQPYLYLL